MELQQIVGRALGWAVSPWMFFGSLIRGDRLLHPDGVVYRAEVRRIAKDGPVGMLAERLAGTALARLSGGFWQWPAGRNRPDVLGVSVRFRAADELTPSLLPGDQDLLFASARSLPELAVAPWRTDAGDFLNNHYYTLLPFELDGVGEVYLRLVPEQRAPAGTDRHDRLARAASQDMAVLQLQLRVGDTGETWVPVVDVDLREQLPIDEDLLVFDPGTSAMGLEPSGVLQSMRSPIYTASQLGWQLRRGPR